MKAFALIFLISLALFGVYKWFFSTPPIEDIMQVIDFPEGSEHTYADSVVLLNEDADSASLLVSFSSMLEAGSVLGLHIDTASGVLRTDLLKELSYSNVPLQHGILDCNTTHQTCLLLSHNRRGQLFPLAVLAYNYETGSTKNIYTFSQDSAPLLATCTIDNQVVVRTFNSSYAVDRDSYQVEADTPLVCSSDIRVPWADFWTLMKTAPPDFRKNQEIRAESTVISDGCQGFCSYQKDHFLKKRNGEIIFQFRTVNNDLEPLGYFGGRYYFQGEEDAARGFWGVVDLRDRLKE